MKKLLIASLLVLLVVTGCGKIPVLENGQEAVVTLKGGDISIDDLYNQMKDSYALQTLIDMVDLKLLNKDYPSNDDEKDYIKDTKKQLQENYEGSYYVNYYSSFEQFLYAYYGVSDITDVERLMSLAYKREQLVKDYAKSIVTEDEIKKYYDNTVIGDIKASHILIVPEYEDDATAEEIAKAKAEALKTAKSIIEKLDKGEEFAKLAKKYSADKTSADGGNLGWFNRDEMVKQFEDAAVALKVDEYTKTPVETKYGYHIILKTGSKDKPKLKEIKDDIIKTLSTQKLTNDKTLQYKALINLRDNAKFAIQDDELARQYKNYINNLLD